MDDKPTCAELLILVADDLKLDKGKIRDFTADVKVLQLGGMDLSTAFARTRLALELSKRPAELRFRAIVEGWNLPRIIQEMY